MFTEARPISLGVNFVLMMITLIACIHQIYGKNIYKAMFQSINLVIISLTFFVFCAMLFKIRLFIEELFYVNSDYKKNYFLVFQATINFNIASWTVIAISFFSFLILVIHSNFGIMQMIQINPLATLLAAAFSLILLYSVDIMECRTTKVATIFSSGGLDPGTAMACSYFYGYLKIMLPASGGNERLGILSSLETYEAKQGIKIPVKKLFILIPSSSYIPPDLREVSDNMLEAAGKLETIAIDRAGVKDRTYHNTVYKIHKKGLNQSDPVYVATEGATPLKTFLEVQDQSHRYASLYREYNHEIIRNFYIALQNILNDNPDCRDYCELVYYEDFIDGKRINPANILLQRITSYVEE